MKRIYLDVEIQNVENPGYAPLTRGNDYLSRMITSQNGKEYDYRNYDGMKKTYVIWILPQAAKKRDGHVNRINSKLENVSGSTIERLESYDKSEQIMIYLNKDHDIKDKYEDSDWIKTPLVIFLNNTYDLLKKKEIMKEYGCGCDCSSMTELMLSKAMGCKGADIMFSSNATPAEEYQYAAKLGAIINLDDITHIDFLEKAIGYIPETISCRYNPGGLFKISNDIMDNPGDAKYGMTT